MEDKETGGDVGHSTELCLFTLDRFAHSGNSSCGLFLFWSHGVGAFVNVTWVGVLGLSGVFG